MRKLGRNRAGQELAVSGHRAQCEMYESLREREKEKAKEKAKEKEREREGECVLRTYSGSSVVGAAS